MLPCFLLLSIPEFSNISDTNGHIPCIKIFDDRYHKFSGCASHILELGRGDFTVDVQELDQLFLDHVDGFLVEIKIFFYSDDQTFVNQNMKDFF